MEKYLQRTSSAESLTGKRPAENSLASRSKRPIQNAPTGKPISTYNKFESLVVDNAEDRADDPVAVTLKKATRKRQVGQIPPILVELLGDWSHKNIKETIEKYDKGFHLQFRGRNRVKVQCYTAKGHQQVKEGLLKEKVAFHTFSRKDEKLPKAVIKGLPKFVQEDLTAELASMGFPGATISELKTQNPTECPPLLVQLPSGSEMGKFKQIRYLFNCIVSIDKFKPNNKAGTQCFRCQGFGHASKNCNRPAKCVKCALDHPTWECTKKNRDEPALCCNCNMAHPANYSQCSERIKYLGRIQSKREALRKSINTNIEPASSVNVKHGTWAQVAGSSKSYSVATPRSNVTYMPDIQLLPTRRSQGEVVPNDKQVKPNPPNAVLVEKTHIHDLATAEMLEILNTIKTIKNEFTNCKTFMEKVILILTHLGHYV